MHVEVQFGHAVEKGKVSPIKEVTPPQIPEDVSSATKSGKVRAPTHIISTSSDDRGEEPYNFRPKKKRKKEPCAIVVCQCLRSLNKDMAWEMSFVFAHISVCLYTNI